MGKPLTINPADYGYILNADHMFKLRTQEGVPLDFKGIMESMGHSLDDDDDNP